MGAVFIELKVEYAGHDSLLIENLFACMDSHFESLST